MQIHNGTALEWLGLCGLVKSTNCAVPQKTPTRFCRRNNLVRVSRQVVSISHLYKCVQRKWARAGLTRKYLPSSSNWTRYLFGMRTSTYAMTVSSTIKNMKTHRKYPDALSCPTPLLKTKKQTKVKVREVIC